MTVATPDHVEIGGVEFLLDEEPENHFVHALDAFSANGQGAVIGVDGVTNSKSVFWELTDWSGGQGYANWSPQYPWGYYASENVGTRVRGRIKAQDRFHAFTPPSGHLGMTGGGVDAQKNWNGRQYFLDESDSSEGDARTTLWEYDAFANCTRSTYAGMKREKFYRKVFDWGEVCNVKGLIAGSNMLIAWVVNAAGNDSFVGHGGGFDSEIMVSRPLIELPLEVTVIDITYGNGSLWLLAQGANDAWQHAWILEADLGSGQVVPRKEIDPIVDEDLGISQPDIGTRIAFAHGDIWIDPGYLYNLETDSLHHVKADINGDNALWTGSYDMGYPFENKLILGVYGKGAGSATLYDDQDNAQATVTPLNGYTAITPFSTKRLSMKLEPRCDYVAVEGIVVPNSNLGSGVNEYWYLKLRLRDESEGTQMVSSNGTPLAGDSMRAQLWSAVNGAETLNFKNFYAEPFDGVATPLTVIVDSIQDSVTRVGEGTCTIILRRLNAV